MIERTTRPRRARGGLALAAALLALAGPARGQEREDPMQRFEAAADTLVGELEAAAREGVRVRSDRVTPEALGWRSDRHPAPPARRVVVWGPSGVHRALGLLPRAGTYTELRPPPAAEPGAPYFVPAVLAVGPELIVVSAPEEAVAVTRRAEEAAAPLLARALAPLEPWRAELAPGAAAPLPPELARARAVRRHPHYAEVELSSPPDVVIDLVALGRCGVEVLVVLHAPAEGGDEPPPTVILTAP